MPDAQFTFDGLPGTLHSAYVADPGWHVYPVAIDFTADGMQIRGVSDELFSLFVTIDVEGFGRTCLPVDGDGGGLTVGSCSLAVELLRSRAARCHKLSAEASAPQWHAIADDVDRAVRSGDAGACGRLLGAAIVAAEELLYQRQLAKADGSGAVISATLFGERRDTYSIGVGPDWTPQAPPDFTRDPQSLNLALDLIQGTTLPNFWRYIEFERGQPQWGRVDQIVERAAARGIELKSFALYWGGIGGCPPWFRTLSYPQQLAAIEQWVKTVVERYQGQVSCWETVNEMHNWVFGNPFLWSHDQMLEVTRLVNELVGTLDPGTPRLINNCCIWGDYLQGGAGQTWLGSEWQPDWTPLDYLQSVHELGIPYEVIGLQYYNPGRDIQTCYETLEKYTTFGKAIQVTEMGTPSAPARASAVETGQVDPMSGWRGVWNPQRQAMWLDRFFTIFGSSPWVTALNYWDFDDTQAFIESAGLVDEKFRPKPSYDVLLDHAQRWRRPR